LLLILLLLLLLLVSKHLWGILSICFRILCEQTIRSWFGQQCFWQLNTYSSSQQHNTKV